MNLGAIILPILVLFGIASAPDGGKHPVWDAQGYETKHQTIWVHIGSLWTWCLDIQSCRWTPFLWKDQLISPCGSWNVQIQPILLLDLVSSYNDRSWSPLPILAQTLHLNISNSLAAPKWYFSANITIASVNDWGNRGVETSGRLLCSIMQILREILREIKE